MKKRVMLILSCLFLSIGFIFAQTTKISGTVVDNNGESVIGASVVVKGTTIGVSTGLDGEFTIEVPDGKNTLVFSLVGMTSVESAAKQGMRVVMSDKETALDEVMVVAYGVAKKSAFTGSAGVVNTDAIIKRQTSNVANALTGQVSGIQVINATGQPGSQPTINIRGMGSMSASNKPLYVVDGVAFEGDISTLSSQDIESMTVLKDAASSALYGSKGANGVIMITTRKGTSIKPQITFDAKWGTNSRQVPNYDVIKDPGTYYEKAYEAIYNGAFYAGKDHATARNTALNTLYTNKGGGVGYRVFDYPAGESLIGEDGKLNPNAKLGYATGNYYFTPDDWYDEVFQDNNLRQEYNLSVSGRSDKINYYFAANYLEDTGIIPGSDFSRLSTRSNIDIQATNWLKLSANMSYANTNSGNPSDQTSSGSSGNIFLLANMISPIYPLYIRNADGSIMRDNYNRQMYDYGDGNSMIDFPYTRTFMNMSNPMSALQLDTRDYKADVFSGRWSVQVTPLEGLRLNAIIGYDIDNTRMRRMNNPFYGQHGGENEGYIYIASYKDKVINYQYTATYNKSFKEHNFDILIGYEGWQRQSDDLSGSRKYMYDPSISELGNAVNEPQASSGSNTYATESLLSRLQYDYNDEVFASATYTRLASSRFHKDQRWGNFWSLGGAWIINKRFLQNQKWIDLLKFKASYGELGNDRLLYRGSSSENYHVANTQYDIQNMNNSWATVENYVGNKDLTWEKQQSLNIGIDFELFKRRLTGNVEYFRKRTSDMLYYKPMPPSGGFAYYPMNIGSMINQGVEVDLHGVIYQNKDWRVGAFANITYWKNNIEKLAPELEGSYVDGTRLYKEGRPYYNLYLRKYAGINEKGLALYYQDVEEDGVVVDRITTTDYQAASKYEMGSVVPKVYGGFGLNADFKGFDFSIAFSYQLGGKVYDNTYSSLMHAGGSNAGTNWHKDILNSWSEGNPGGNIPRVSAVDTYTNSTSDRFLISSDYLNLQNITLGYTLPASITSKLKIGSLRVYGVADNVWLASKRKGLDPRKGSVGGITSGASYSAVRTLSGGVTITF